MIERERIDVKRINDKLSIAGRSNLPLIRRQTVGTAGALGRSAGWAT